MNKPQHIMEPLDHHKHTYQLSLPQQHPQVQNSQCEREKQLRQPGKTDRY